jgi:Domain of unknown function (DUF4158)
LAVQFFSDEQVERLRSYPNIGREELIRFFTLKRKDLGFIDNLSRGGGRGSAARLGLAIQLCTLPWLGFVPDDIWSVPQAAVQRLAVFPGALQQYGRRAQTRSDHLKPSGIPEVPLVTGWEPGAGPWNRGGRQLIGGAGAEEGMDLSETARPDDGGVGDECRPDALHRVVVRAVARPVQQFQLGMLVQVGGDDSGVVDAVVVADHNDVRGSWERGDHLIEQKQEVGCAPGGPADTPTARWSSPALRAR